MQTRSRSTLRSLGRFDAPADASCLPHRGGRARPAADWSARIANALAARIEAVMTVHRGAYEAAAAYEELSRLSDAELERRRLSRAGITRQIFKILTRPKQ